MERQGRALRVAVTGAAGQIAYSLLPSLANGSVFGPTQPVQLSLLDIPNAVGAMQGVAMELDDCSLPLLAGVTVTDRPEEAFKDADYIVLLGAMPRREGMDRSDLLRANVRIFADQGRVIDTVAAQNVKVLVVGNPANTNALVCASSASSRLQRCNVSALTRLDQNRACSMLAQRLGVSVDRICNVTIFGNHSNTQYPDVENAALCSAGSANCAQSRELAPLVLAKAEDKEYVQNEFIKTVSLRGGAILAARKLSSAMSAAKAVCDHLRDWHHGTAPGVFVSMGVLSDGSYGIEKDLIFSFPVSIEAKTGKWSIVQNLKLSDFARSKLKATEEELISERKLALEFINELKSSSSEKK